MANAEHLKILKEGVEVWNWWREEEPEIRPDLSRADLRNADLRYAELSRADLSRADLQDAILSYTNLYGANLNYADLDRANLFYANLNDTILTGTGFYNAKMNNSDLSVPPLRVPTGRKPVRMMHRRFVHPPRRAAHQSKRCRQHRPAPSHVSLLQKLEQTVEQQTDDPLRDLITQLKTKKELEELKQALIDLQQKY